MPNAALSPLGPLRCRGPWWQVPIGSPRHRGGPGLVRCTASWATWRCTASCRTGASALREVLRGAR
eukprot:14271827-Heterocapsa_arctica.AAC.1